MIDSLISITENILADIQEDYLLFLQDMFPYLEKYLVTYYLPKLAERIEYVMKQDTHSYCDRALLLDYKAELFLIKNDYKNALKKRLKAVSILEPYHTEDADQRTANLLSNLYNNLSEGNAKEAELHLLSAENIISEVMETDNDYAKTVYLYLNNLYSRWQKPEQALAYKNKYIKCSK